MKGRSIYGDGEGVPDAFLPNYAAPITGDSNYVMKYSVDDRTDIPVIHPSRDRIICWKLKRWEVQTLLEMLRDSGLVALPERSDLAKLVDNHFWFKFSGRRDPGDGSVCYPSFIWLGSASAFAYAIKHIFRLTTSRGKVVRVFQAKEDKWRRHVHFADPVSSRLAELRSNEKRRIAQGKMSEEISHIEDIWDRFVDALSSH